jgi:predicted nucleic acid-binding protein
MIILDTQHVSQLQREASRDAQSLQAKIDASPGCPVYLMIITAYEQFRGCLGDINAKRGPEQLRSFALLGRLIDVYAKWAGRILPYDEAASSILQQFEPKLIRRIGSCDAKIAAIALAHGASLKTSNTRDFQQVPGLNVEDWLA